MASSQSSSTNAVVQPGGPLGVSPASMRLVQQLVGQPPRSMEELIAASGVTRTAVTEQLSQLVGAGYVMRVTERTGRGRPRYLYSATGEAMQLLFRNNQRMLAPLMVKALLQVAGPDVAARVLDEVGQLMAEHYLSRMDSTADTARRAQQFVELLRQEGIMVELEVEDGRLRIRERTCPFVDTANDSRAICAVERQMMTNVLGAAVTSSGCRLDGCAGCTFEISPPVTAAKMADPPSLKS